MASLKQSLSLLIVALFVCLAASSESEKNVSEVGKQLNWKVIASGGNRGISTDFVLDGTVAQTAVGHGSSTNFRLNQGYWQRFMPGFICGDADGSGMVDISDAVYLIQYIFQGGPAPVPEVESGDADCSGTVDISDAVYLIQYIFSGGPAPCANC